MDCRDTAPLRQYLGIEVFPVVYSAAANEDGPELKFAPTFNGACLQKSLKTWQRIFRFSRLPDEMCDIFFMSLQEQPRTQASSRYPSFAPSLTGYVTSEIA